MRELTPRLTSRLVRSVSGLVLLGLTAACTTQAKTTTAADPPNVPVVLAQQRDLSLEATFTGRVEAVHRVEVRSRVSGALDAVLFREGAQVSAGAPLFQIDNRPYEIAARRQAADVAAIQAQLTRAREEFDRAERLAGQDAVSVEEVARRRSEAAILTARLDAARAAAADAALMLEWTTIHAPVSGTVGKAEVTIGNLVTGGPGDGTRLAVLQSLDQVYVYFDLDPQTAARARASGRTAWRASVTEFDGGTAVEGPIDFVDNTVGAQTGLLKVRARIPNNGGKLLPAAVVRVAFRYGTAQATTVVPEIAVGSDQGSRYVLIAGDDGVVEYRAVTLGVKSGAWRAVSDVVRPGERVVLPGLMGLRPGMKVTPDVEVMR